MTDAPHVPDAPGAPGAASARIGVDDWVASHGERRGRRGGPFGRLRDELERVPRLGLYAAFGAAAAFVPLLTSNEYAVRVGFDTLIYMLLALGLNVVVGYAGLLELGYVAFFGFGAYAYAMLASPKFDIHLATPLVLLIATFATAVLGLLVALPSRRLIGDYLAIVTLFFGQFFVTVVNNGNRISALGQTRGYDVTGGPNGIADIDPFHVFGRDLIAVEGYYWAALAVFMVALLAVYLLDLSRTGRAWRSLREDSLAAELMGMPVNRLKLLAFMVGAAIGGLAGTLFAALNTTVFAANFDTPTLIVVYAMLILGGAGSLGGVIVGAIVVNVSLELLRTPEKATAVFYVLVLVALLVKLRPWRWLVGVLAGTVVFGLVVNAIVGAVWSSSGDGKPSIGGWIGSAIEHWVVLPGDARTFGKIAFLLLIGAVLGLTLISGVWQKLALIPTLYLSTVAWENLLVKEPSVTRLILVGVILIVLMNARPQGLLGTARVEIA